MDSKLQNQLEEAKVHFRCWRLLESYHGLRRYFDRLPFAPEKEHAEYIGMFVRVLLELGKEFELKFYMKELERIFRSSHNPHIGYALGMVYCFIPEPRMEAARSIFEQIVKDPAAKEFHAKSKMMLAHYYDKVKDDVATCRIIIDSIDAAGDKDLEILLRIWRAKLLRGEKKFDEAEAGYRAILRELESNKDWYAYTSASLGLAFLYVMRGDRERARGMADEVKSLFEGRQFRSVQATLATLEKELEAQAAPGTLYVETGLNESTVTYVNKSLVLKSTSSSGKLLLLLVKKKLIDKAHIVKVLYDRQYLGEQDDKLIYYHIHSLRKRLKDLGLGLDAIEVEAGGYRLVPRVERIGEEL